MNFRIHLCASLLLLAPAVAAAQDPVPEPPKQEIVTIRSAGGTLELKGTSSADQLEFTQQCESRQGYTTTTASLTLPLEIEGGPNGSLEQTTAILREAVARGFLVTVEGSSEPRSRVPRVMFTWGTLQVFEGVVESLSIKYTLFSPDGTPARATVHLRLKEASSVMNKGESKEADQPGKKQSDCSPKH